MHCSELQWIAMYCSKMQDTHPLQRIFLSLTGWASPFSQVWYFHCCYIAIHCRWEKIAPDKSEIWAIQICEEWQKNKAVSCCNLVNFVFFFFRYILIVHKIKQINTTKIIIFPKSLPNLWIGMIKVYVSRNTEIFYASLLGLDPYKTFLTTTTKFKGYSNILCSWIHSSLCI